MSEKTQAQKAKDALDAANAAKALKDAAKNQITEPTQEEKDKAAAEAQKIIDDEAAKAAEADAKVAKPKVGVFLNPFDKGVTYETFLSVIPKGTSVKDFCKGKLVGSELNWIVEEIKHFKNNNKK